MDSLVFMHMTGKAEHKGTKAFKGATGTQMVASRPKGSTVPLVYRETERTGSALRSSKYIRVYYSYWGVWIIQQKEELDGLP